MQIKKCSILFFLSGGIIFSFFFYYVSSKRQLEWPVEKEPEIPEMVKIALEEHSNEYIHMYPDSRSLWTTLGPELRLII